ncbi:MgtC/SapB family protein [Chitinophagaceae bacterium LWZ2-11]
MVTVYVIKILLAFVCGAVLGIEREFRGKPAGFRTMILICIGSCTFSILSAFSTSSPDRIVSNIVTGIGFLGAGVVFKEGVTVRGITSAAVIWVTAGIGMAIGFDHFYLATSVTVIVLAVMIILSRLEDYLDGIKQKQLYKISFNVDDYSLEQLEQCLKDMDVKFTRSRISKDCNVVSAYYKVDVTKTIRDVLNRYLINTEAIKSFEV